MTLAEEKQIKLVAKKFLYLSLDDDRVSLDKVKKVLAALKKYPMRHMKKILYYYFRFLKRQIGDSIALIEYCGCIEEEKLGVLHDKMKRHYNRELDMQTRINENLLAGIKVYVGDDIWENSIISRIDFLTKQLS